MLGKFALLLIVYGGPSVAALLVLLLGVAIARTLAAGSEILLMDEPFGALDAQTREHLQGQLRSIQRQDAKTIIFVTHDVEEALFIADRVLVFSKRPARLIAEIDVAARFGPDRQIELRETAEFFKMRNELLRLVRHEVMASPR